MSSEFRFTSELVRIVNGALRLDVDKVRNYTAFLAQKLEAAGETAAAERLRKALDGVILVVVQSDAIPRSGKPLIT